MLEGMFLPQRCCEIRDKAATTTIAAAATTAAAAAVSVVVALVGVDTVERVVGVLVKIRRSRTTEAFSTKAFTFSPLLSAPSGDFAILIALYLEASQNKTTPVLRGAPHTLSCSFPYDHLSKSEGRHRNPHGVVGYVL